MKIFSGLKSAHNPIRILIEQFSENLLKIEAQYGVDFSGGLVDVDQWTPFYFL